LPSLSLWNKIGKQQKQQKTATTHKQPKTKAEHSEKMAGQLANVSD